MGALSTVKVIKNVSGTLTEETTLTTSAGAGDTNKLVALNASGILDSTIVNSKTTSAGAGDTGKLAALNASGILDDTIINASATVSANKIAKLNASGILAPALVNATIASAGAGDSGKIPQLDAAGRIDVTVLPVGIGADTQSITTSEALAAGDYVNVWSSTGFKARKADATVAGKHAMGFVLVGAASGAAATVYFEGTNTAVTGQSPGDVFLSTTAGLGVTASPTGSGNVVQPIGFATTATSVNFQAGRPITLA